MQVAKNYTPANTVRTQACLGSPGFNYVVGCVTSGKPPEKPYSTLCKEPPCVGITGPPFPGCRAIASVCGGTCGTDAIEPFDRDDPRADRNEFCNVSGATGEIFVDEIKEFYLQGLVPDYASVIFAIVYMMGIASLVQVRTRPSRWRGVLLSSTQSSP